MRSQKLSLAATALVNQVLGQACAAPQGVGATFQTLHYNNLGPENNGTAFVAVRDILDHSTAAAACSKIGESLVTISELSTAHRDELQLQLTYLVETDNLGDDVAFWVKDGGKCSAYTVKSSISVEVQCDKRLPALCTSTVAPSSDTNRKHEPSSEVTVPSGGLNIKGYRDKRSFRFLAIPYADPPVDKLRFMAPRNYSGKADIDATTLPASCMQAESPYGDTSNASEDCLYLNVFTPVVPSSRLAIVKQRPVAVYFYGGAFVEGAISLIDYDGGNFASRSDVVVVTVNYRLGALGFLATNSLIDGSMGIKDQVQALRWVQDNIASFGGDPSKVTIFGQSAGGQSTVALLSSSAAKGMFRGAISQSAPVDLPWFTREVYTKLITPQVAGAVKCGIELSEKDLVKCLQSAPAESFINSAPGMSLALNTIKTAVANGYFHSSTFVAAIEPFLPMVDDNHSGIIDGQFDELIQAGKLPSAVPVMFSTVANEGTLFVNRVLKESIGNSQATLDAGLPILFPPKLAAKILASGVFQVDKNDPDGTRNMVGDLVTYSEWSCAQGYILDHAVSVFPSAYQVQIGSGHQQANASEVTPTCFPNHDYNATCHTADVLPVWGNLNSKSISVLPYYSNDDILHSQFMNDIWGSFFHTLDPNPDSKALERRGPAYAYTSRVFGADGYKLKKHTKKAQNVSFLSIPPKYVDNPGASKQCAVFTDNGYTFQHASFGILGGITGRALRRWFY
ncbi:hypothetical protein VHEMI04375 [[Torrubiella] hemipterigena]|uniref:Carboxylesterase type B domain-containing protein n=1 Tax=[Torrubiella] hemipterigena TaxID=1531966 RepID=A0A0A1TDM2_9HYPO|nr:hypothetical protein VHEMI04375 [[Torrubiella] hemipterigena]